MLKLRREDGISGDTSTITIEVELGYGSKDSPMATVEVDFTSIYNSVSSFITIESLSYFILFAFHHIPSNF